MKSEKSYEEIAIEDLEDASNFFDKGRYGKCVKYCEQYIEKYFKQIIHDHEELDDTQRLVDNSLLMSHKVVALAKRVSEITGASYTRSEYNRFRSLQNYYFNTSYPGENYLDIDKDEAEDVLSWTNSFKVKSEDGMKNILVFSTK